MLTESRNFMRLTPLSRLVKSTRFLLLGAGLTLAGCGTNRTVSTAPQLESVQQRHPIALMEQPYVLDTFPSHDKGRLDPRTREQLSDYARSYLDLGHGTISVLIPSNGPDAKNDSKLVGAFRRELAHNGVSAPIAVTRYPIENPKLASPVRFAFDGVKAKVMNKCGEWPRDLSSGSSTQNWDNRTYWNFGCANQNMIAEQTADPRDIASPRGAGAQDNTFRTRAIENVRHGQNPSITWGTQNSQIGTVGQ